MKIMNWLLSGIILLVAFISGCAVESNGMSNDTINLELNPNRKIETAYFAGGCFWCMESGLESVDGVVEVISGYSNGDVENPSYEEVSAGTTGHLEAVEVQYDANIISYEKLLENYWIQINPTDDGGQFSDRGEQYKTVIFFKTEEERIIAEKSKKEVANSFDKPIVTEIIKFKNFYAAEEYHQDFYIKKQFKYNFYAKLSGRKDFVEDNKERIVFAEADSPAKSLNEYGVEYSEEELKEMLTDLQYKVTQKDGTEQAFNNEYWDNKEAGIYVDVVSGEPLFSSIDKYKSGTGWPSFTKPIASDYIVEKKDYKLVWPRTEIRSKNADSHIGHLFSDGPEPTGLRYCMNSAALRFVPVADMEAEGYGEYLELFENVE